MRPASRLLDLDRLPNLKSLHRKRSVRWAAQLVALAIVAWGIVHTGRKAADQLTAQQQQLRQQASELDERARSAPAVEGDQLRSDARRLRERAVAFWRASPSWLLVSGLTYALGMIPAGLYWRLCLRRLDQPAPLLRTMYSYFLGHLGKYFPGKAMVIVLRIAVLAPLGGLKVATTLTIFMETLTMMAVGSAVAAASLLWLRADWRWTLLACGLMFLTFVPTLPPLLREVLKRTQPNVDPPLMKSWLRRIDWNLTGRGWLALAVTWLGYGASLYCVLRASPSAEFAAVDAITIGLSSLGACAMAVVLGFVSFLPGGAGVREVVLSTMLSPIVGPVAAIAAAVWLRIVWLVTEIVVVCLLRIACWLRREHTPEHRVKMN